MTTIPASTATPEAPTRELPRYEHHFDGRHSYGQVHTFGDWAAMEAACARIETAIALAAAEPGRHATAVTS